jgi:hypothetical protein
MLSHAAAHLIALHCKLVLLFGQVAGLHDAAAERLLLLLLLLLTTCFPRSCTQSTCQGLAVTGLPQTHT